MRAGEGPFSERSERKKRRQRQHHPHRTPTHRSSNAAPYLPYPTIPYPILPHPNSNPDPDSNTKISLYQSLARAVTAGPGPGPGPCAESDSWDQNNNNHNNSHHNHHNHNNGGLVHHRRSLDNASGRGLGPDLGLALVLVPYRYHRALTGVFGHDGSDLFRHNKRILAVLCAVNQAMHIL